MTLSRSKVYRGSAVRALALAAVALLAGCRGGDAAVPAGGDVAVDDRAVPAGRLDDRARPVRGVLELEVTPGAAGFSGRVSYELELRRPVSALWLHAAGLAIGAARLERGAESRVLEPLSAPAERELIGFDLGGTAAPGRARLVIDFRGRFGTDSGLFTQRQNGRAYAFTDFEPTDARTAFPCFDDPRFKIPWQVALTVPADSEAFANGPERARRVLADGRVRVEFAPTRPLPSYLVAVAAGPFDVLEGPREPVPLRVIAPAGHAERGRFALATAARMLHSLEAYFGSPTPYPKIDLIAVPEFYGAMENPGLITFAQRLLLVDPARASRDAQRLSAGVIAHELAHLWFGDLVTMQWWNDLWLNEGFATWLSDKTVAAWAPDEAGWVLSIADKRPARTMDRRGEARVVRQPIADEREIAATFDAITYRKGGAILAMIEAWLGADAVRRGVRDYVNAHADGSARAEDLVAALERAAGRPVGPVLASFLEQPGIPVVEVEARCDGGGARVELRQRAYGGGSARWQVPVCVRYAAGGAAHRQCELLDEARQTVPLAACPEWLLPNDGERGYYFYDLAPAALAALARAPGLSQRELAGLVETAAALTWEGTLPALDAVAAIAAVAGRGDAHALELAAEELLGLERALPRRHRARFGAAVRAGFGAAARDALARLGAPPTADTGYAAVRLLSELGPDPAFARQARLAVERALSADLDRADLALLDAALRAAAPTAGPAFFAATAAAAERTSGATRRLLERAPLWSHDPGILGAALERLRGPELSPFELGALAHAAADPATRDLVEAFLVPGARLGFAPERLALIYAERCDHDAAALVAELAPAARGDAVGAEIRRCADGRARIAW